MSHQRGLRAWLGGSDAPLAMAKLGIALSVLLLGLRLLASQVFILTIPLAVGTASAVYLVTWNRQPPSVAHPSLPRAVADYLPAAVVAGLAVLVWLTASAGSRTLPVHLLTGVVGALVLVQVLLEDRMSTGVVLVEILAVAVVVRLSTLFVTPGFVGVDIWTHVPVFVEGIVRAGSLSAIADSKYVMAPFYHLVGAAATLILGDARVGVYLTLGLFVTLSSLFVYATADLFLPRRGALLATALFAFSDQFVRWGMHVIPTSLGLAFFLGCLYCVTKLFFTDADGWVVLLLAAFSLAVVFTHQVSTAILLVFLGIAVVVAISLDVLDGGEGSRVSRSTLSLSTVFAGTLGVTLWSWSNTPFSGGTVFLWNRVDVVLSAFGEARFLSLAGGSADAAAGGSAGGAESLAASMAPYVDVFGFTLLLTAGVLGGLVMLDWEAQADATLTVLLAAATMFVAVFGLSIFGVTVLLPGRWMAFMYAPLVVVGAVGVSYLSGNASRPVTVAVVLLLALGYPTTMAVAEKATLDSPAFDETYPRFSYTESEIAAAETIDRIRPPDRTPDLHSDHPYRTLFESRSGYDARVLVMRDGRALSESAVVYRDYQSTGPVVFHRPGEIPRAGFTANYGPESVCPPDRDHVYANDQVRLCIPPATGSGGAG